MGNQQVGKYKSIFYESITYPIYQLIKGPTFGFRSINVLKELNKSQWLSSVEMTELQNEKLKKMIKHVYNNVSYYHDIMKESGIRPDDIRTIDDLKYFPVLTKSEIKNNFKDVLSKDYRRRSVIKSQTGGTTGEPLVFYRDINTLLWTEAALLRGWSWAGYKLGYKLIRFSIDDWPSLLGGIRIKLINMHYFPALSKKDKLEDYFNRIRKITPCNLTGLSSALYRIAIECNRNMIKQIIFPVIFTTAEMLFDYQRELIEKVFKGKVYDYYGCNEIGSLAYECEYNKKHITDEHVIIETVDSKGSSVMNQPGEITITDLDNYAMPFIRYKNGDVGTITDEKCHCSRGLKLLTSLDGRSQDFLKTVDDNLIPSIYFPTNFRHLKGIEQFQIIQENIHNIRFKFVKNKNYSDVEFENVIRIIRDKIGGTVSISVEECKHIELTGRGKTRLVISNISKEF